MRQGQEFSTSSVDQPTRSASEGVKTIEVTSFLFFRVTLFRDALLPESNSK